MTTTYKICKDIRRALLTLLSECAIYKTWEDSFAIQEVRNAPDKVLARYGTIDPNDLTLEEMKDLGFQRWSDDNPMMLIPLWLYPFLPNQLECECINGEKGIRSKERIDSDHRGGMLAYGVHPKK